MTSWQTSEIIPFICFPEKVNLTFCTVYKTEFEKNTQ